MFNVIYLSLPHNATASSIYVTLCSTMNITVEDTTALSLLHVCLSVVLQFVVYTIVMRTTQQTSIGGCHTCTSTIANEQLQHTSVACGKCNR